LRCEPSLLAVLNFFHGISFPARFFEEEGVTLSEAAYAAPLCLTHCAQLLFN
jgi:hypothetical protein